MLLLFPILRPVLSGNTTLSFLITTDVDVGDLMIVKLRWEKDTIISWTDWWGSSKFHIRKLRIKSGETQSKWVLGLRQKDKDKWRYLEWSRSGPLTSVFFFFLFVISGWSSALRTGSSPTSSGEEKRESLSSLKKTTWTVKKSCKFIHIIYCQLQVDVVQNPV